jgi:hypothetical protein
LLDLHRRMCPRYLGRTRVRDDEPGGDDRCVRGDLRRAPRWPPTEQQRRPSARIRGVAAVPAPDLRALE